MIIAKKFFQILMIPLFVKFWDLPQSWGGTTWQLWGEGGDGEGDRRDLGALEVTPENIAVNLRVTRGPDWTWSDEDGGEGKTGVILSFDKSKAIAQVLWEGGQAHKHYRFGLKSDLMICIGANSSLGRRNSQLFFASKSQTLLIFDWDDTLFPTTYVLWLGLCAASGVSSCFLPGILVLFCICSGIVKNWSKTKLGTWWGLDIIDRHANMYWNGFQDLPSKTAQKAWVLYGLTRPFSRYDKTFKRPKRIEQRFLTEVRDDLKLVWNKPLKEQDLSSAEKNSIGKKLELCASHAVELLKQADRFGVLDQLVSYAASDCFGVSKTIWLNSLTEEKLSYWRWHEHRGCLNRARISMRRLAVSSRSSRFPLSMRKKASRWATVWPEKKHEETKTSSCHLRVFTVLLPFPQYCRVYMGVLVLFITVQYAFLAQISEVYGSWYLCILLLGYVCVAVQ